jgi:O-succinylhomoserine sulfhydrylase
VYYPGLPSHPQHDLAMRQQSGNGGAVVSFTLKPAAGAITVSGKALPDDALRLRQAAFHVIDHTQLCSITANLGDTKTLITHPSSTSHGRLSEAQRLSAGITQGMVRISVGLDHPDDVTADLARGLHYLTF